MIEIRLVARQKRVGRVDCVEKRDYGHITLFGFTVLRRGRLVRHGLKVLGRGALKTPMRRRANARAIAAKLSAPR